MRAEHPSTSSIAADSTYLRIASHLAGQVDIRGALEAIVSEIGDIVDVDHVDVCLLDEAEAWCTSYEVGFETHWSHESTKVSCSPLRAILTGDIRFMLTDDALCDERYLFPGSNSGPILDLKLRSRVNVAMMVMGRTIGVLSCSSLSPGRYAARHIAAIGHVADVIAPYFHALRISERARLAAIRRAELMAREEGLRQGALELTSAMEQERQRIGMDLHDQTLADLTRLLRTLEAGGSRIDTGEIILYLSDAISDLRCIIDEAVPSILDMFGFAHAVRIHLERAVAGRGIAVRFDDRTGGAIDELAQTIRTALFRIVQEAVNNAAGHSGAKTIMVDIGAMDDAIMVSVADDGMGLPDHLPSIEDRSAPGGLIHMRTRARLIAADFSIHCEGGTRIRVCLPVSRVVEHDQACGAGEL
ncbi:sensor histidine kinase [Fulvimarina sp. 2208YS6-2-32]|uniref:histidine kinase n=1 Tax=Fulvimarina uroteuthidis TaxID=3098149 RepID=A0ABU5HXZ4_9HYPH|nr:ATP-binding protein [Fulvimarina sp. 2208YS6-2-32]MDY8107962.1 sensor histidine kinase [Fulvimarina sp. 2208YS6-2-32]